MIEDIEGLIKILRDHGSGCGSVGRAVASDTRGPQFKSSHRQNLLKNCKLSSVLKRRK